jgi:hypothetical protein
VERGLGGREMGEVAPPVSAEFWRQNPWHPGLISNRLISRHLKELISNIDIVKHIKFIFTFANSLNMFHERKKLCEFHSHKVTHMRVLVCRCLFAFS